MAYHNFKGLGEYDLTPFSLSTAAGPCERAGQKRHAVWTAEGKFVQNVPGNFSNIGSEAQVIFPM